MSAKKQSNLHEGEYRCERCWSENNINLYPKSQFVDEPVKGFVILCEKCKGEAPSEKYPTEFENLFLRFASLKEFIQYYNAENEKQARELWIQEMEGKGTILDNTPEDSKNEEDRVGVEKQKTQIGYEVVDDALIINKDQARLVKEIFNLYLEGKTMEKIARELKNKNEKESWSLNEVREILKDPTYAGYKFQGAEVVKAQHEAIVKTETFNNVQQKIQRNIRNPKYRQNPLVLGD
jgi:hypothetical protein